MFTIGQVGDATNSLTSRVYANQTYLIALDGTEGTTGVTPMNLLFTPNPINDQFTNRILLAGPGLLVGGRTYGATKDYWEDNVFSDQHQVAQGNIWWQWTAPSNGWWTLFFKEGTDDHLIVLYQGIVTNRTNEAGRTFYSPINFQASSNGVFQIGVNVLSTVDQKPNLGNHVEFTITPLAAPPPRLTYLDRTAYGNTTALAFPDNSGLPYRLDSSIDLLHWVPVFTNSDFKRHYLTFPVGGAEGERKFFRTSIVNP